VAGHCSASHPRSSPAATAVIVGGLNNEDVEWAKYTSNNALLKGLAVVPCRRLAVYPGFSNDRP